MDRYDDLVPWSRWLTPANDALRTYVREHGRVRPLSDVEQAGLPEQAAGGDDDARQRLTEAHLQLVVIIAKDYADRVPDMIGLLQAGNVGLMRAVDGLDAFPPDMALHDVVEREIRASMDGFGSGGLS